MGLEPTTFGITIRRSNQLSYIYRVVVWECKDTQRMVLCKIFWRKMYSRLCYPTPGPSPLGEGSLTIGHTY
jgi:hypothetical protein